MKPVYRSGESFLKIKLRSTYRRWLRILSTGALTFLLTFDMLTGERILIPVTGPHLQTASALTFTADADAYVRQSYPNSNYGSSSSLLVDGASDPDFESFIRFNVTGVSGVVQNARLRVYATSNGTQNGPMAYAADSSWSETGITWNNRPARTSGVLDNKGKIGTYSWAEYDVTSVVTGDGNYSFVLVADSTDRVRFSSRQGSRPPQLVITLAEGTSTPTPTAAQTETAAPGSTDTPTLEATGTSEPTSTSVPEETSTSTLEPDTPTATATDTPTPTDSLTPTPTSTPPGSAVLVGAGDISLCSNNNDEATAKLLDNIPGTVFTAGDNAYIDGSYTDYINCYDPTWGRHKSRTMPIPGNHEYLTSGAAGYFQYFSNVPAYYAYNLGTWRIYALNSELSVTATSPEVTWLQDDLATHPSQCVLAYWHKPRWSSGSSHGSNSSMQTLWQVLANAGAELVINGHEHNYERFAEMNASGAAASPGMREFVVGTGGNGHYGFATPLSTSQVRDSTTYGVLKLTLRAGGYDWEFVPVAGSTFTDSGSGTCH
jgi:hypothetical protein